MPAQPIPPIRHSRQPGGLFTTARPLETGGEDWRGGITFVQSCGGNVGTWACDEPLPQKEAAPTGDNVRFDTFLLYYEVECDGGFDVRTSEELAQLGLDKGDTAALAKELHGNASGNGNPSLQGGAVDKTSLAGPQSLANSLQALVGMVEECEIGDLTLHAPIWTLPEWLKNDQVVWDGTRFKHGPFDVIFDAYPNKGPELNEGALDGQEPAAGDGEVWLYATGLIERAVDTTVRETVLEHRQNLHTAVVERLAILRFDPCCVAAVRAKVC